MLKTLLLFVICSLTLVQGGYEIKTVTRTKDDKGQTQKMVVLGFVDGPKSKFVFQEGSNNPMMPTGTYLLTKDGGKTLFLVNPKEGTYTPFDLNAMMKMVGGVLNSMGAIVKMEFSEPEITVIKEGKGEDLLGMDTQYQETRTTYETRVKVVGISRVMDNDMIQKTWTTNDLDDMGFAVWLRNDPQPTGNEDLDRLIVSGMKQVKGFPLKTETVTTTRTWNKKKTKVKDETTMSQTMVVESLEKKKLEPSLFEIPEDYVQGQTPEEQSGLDKFKGMFNQ